MNIVQICAVAEHVNAESLYESEEEIVTTASVGATLPTLSVQKTAPEPPSSEGVTEQTTVSPLTKGPVKVSVVGLSVSFHSPFVAQRGSFSPNRAVAILNRFSQSISNAGRENNAVYAEPRSLKLIQPLMESVPSESVAVHVTVSVGFKEPSKVMESDVSPVLHS